MKPPEDAVPEGEGQCPAEAGGYDGLWGVYCVRPKGHNGQHDDGYVRWEFSDGADPWRMARGADGV